MHIITLRKRDLMLKILFDGTEKNLTHIYLGEVLEHIKKPKSFLKSILIQWKKVVFINYCSK